MKKHPAAGMQLLLAEMVLAIGFFSVVAAVCVSLFSSAWQIAEESRAKTGAVLLAESAAECFKASGGDLEKTAAHLGAAAEGGDSLTLFYDEDWALQAQGDYQLQITLTQEENRLTTAEIEVSDGNGVLFSLQAASAGEVLP